jgi:hypothetical protein
MVLAFLPEQDQRVKFSTTNCLPLIENIPKNRLQRGLAAELLFSETGTS